MRAWHFNTLFVVGVGGVIVLLFAPLFHLNLEASPASVSGIGVILTYVLTQRKEWVKEDDKKKTKEAETETSPPPKVPADSDSGP